MFDWLREIRDIHTFEGKQSTMDERVTLEIFTDYV
jgi:hypothetical protein